MIPFVRSSWRPRHRVEWSKLKKMTTPIPIPAKMTTTLKTASSGPGQSTTGLLTGKQSSTGSCLKTSGMQLTSLTWKRSTVSFGTSWATWATRCTSTTSCLTTSVRYLRKLSTSASRNRRRRRGKVESSPASTTFTSKMISRTTVKVFSLSQKLKERTW